MRVSGLAHRVVIIRPRRVICCIFLDGDKKRADVLGLTTPLLFSTQALEANQSRTTLLIQAYLDTHSYVPLARSGAQLVPRIMQVQD